VGKFSENSEVVVQVEVLDHGALWEMIMNGNIEPLFTAFASFLFGPFSLDLAALPCENKNNAWHFEF
jgi:hypothetical protein